MDLEPIKTDRHRKEGEEDLVVFPSSQAELSCLQQGANEIPLALFQTSAPPALKSGLRQAILNQPSAGATRQTVWQKLKPGFPMHLPAIGLALMVILALGNLLLWHQLNQNARNTPISMRVEAQTNTKNSPGARGNLMNANGWQVYTPSATSDPWSIAMLENHYMLDAGRTMLSRFSIAVDSTNTPTPTSVRTNTPTPTSVSTNTPTPTSVRTSTPTPTSVRTNTPTPTTVRTNTPTPTRVLTNTPTPTRVLTNTPTPTSVRTNTPTPTAVRTNTPTPTTVRTNTPTPTSVRTSTPTPTSVRTNTPTPTQVLTNTQTPTTVLTNTPTPTTVLANTTTPTSILGNTSTPTSDPPVRHNQVYLPLTLRGSSGTTNAPPPTSAPNNLINTFLTWWDSLFHRR